MSSFLDDFIADDFFNRGDITIISRDGAYVEGEYVENLPVENTVTTDKVLIPMNGKALVDAGLGEYSSEETFKLWVRDALVFSNGSLLQEGDTIQYETNTYKIILVENWVTHGFYKYIISKQRLGALND